MAKSTPQNYPRIDDVDDHYNGCLNEATLVPHQYKISEDELKRLIRLQLLMQIRNPVDRFCLFHQMLVKMKSFKFIKRKDKTYFLILKNTLVIPQLLPISYMGNITKMLVRSIFVIVPSKKNA